jgi:hypothetical protein
VEELEADQMPCTIVGTVVNVTAYNLSCLGSDTVVPIFVREGVAKLWEVLCTNHDLTLVNGPPRVGKSTVV